MDGEPLDGIVLGGYNKSDIFKLLIIGIFIYTCGSSIAYVSSTLIRDASLLMGVLSMVTLILKECSYHLVFMGSVFWLGSQVFKKVKALELDFSKFMWILIVSYFVLQFFSFAYTYWGYEIIGDRYFTAFTEYNSEIKDSKLYTVYSSYLKFLPHVYCPAILLFFGKKLKS